MPRPAPSRVAAALNYLERLKNQAAEFGGGVVENLADRARSAGELAYEALATDPNMGRMTTAEYAQAADRPTPRLDEAARQVGALGRAIVTQPVETGKAIVQGEVERAREAMSSPRAAGQYAGSFIDPMRIAAALRKTAPILELDVYHGTPHRFEPTEANPLGEFDASKIGTGKGRNLKGKGIYLTENPERAKEYAESFVEPGFVYKSDLPDEMIEMMLEYDVPIKNQSEKIKKALETVGIDPESSQLAGTIVSGLMEGKNQIAEETLAKAGIPGIKVKNIRAKERKYDFVVFPGEEKKVKILERK